MNNFPSMKIIGGKWKLGHFWVNVEILQKKHRNIRRFYTTLKHQKTGRYQPNSTPLHATKLSR